jgi:hypothetical protein
VVACTLQVTCGPLVAKRYPALNSGATGNVKLADNVTSVTAAQAFCDTRGKTASEPAWCGHYAGNQQVWWYPKSKSYLKDYPSSPTMYAADCG